MGGYSAPSGGFAWRDRILTPQDSTLGAILFRRFLRRIVENVRHLDRKTCF